MSCRPDSSGADWFMCPLGTIGCSIAHGGRTPHCIACVAGDPCRFEHDPPVIERDYVHAAAAAPRYSFTQGCCVPCWNERHPDRPATSVIEADPETCVHCGGQSTSGIYVRIDPKTAAFPTRLKD